MARYRAPGSLQGRRIRVGQEVYDLRYRRIARVVGVDRYGKHATRQVRVEQVDGYIYSTKPMWLTDHFPPGVVSPFDPYEGLSTGEVDEEL